MRPSRRTALFACATALAASVGVTLTTTNAEASPVFGNGSAVMTAFAAPKQSVHISPVLVGDPDFAGEPSVGVNWKTGAGMYIAGTNVLKLGLTASNVTWTDVSPATGLSQNLDPILTVQPNTGTTIAGGDTGACSGLFASSDDGGLWTPSIPCTATTDHPTVSWAPSALTPGSYVYYYCQQEVLNNCATSTDGLIWTPGANFNADCISLHGHLRGGPDGTAYLPNGVCASAGSGGPQGVLLKQGTNLVGGLKTLDDGLFWDTYTIPGAITPASGFDPAVTVDAGNTLYEAWNNAGNYHPVIASSKDKGATWSPTVDLANTVSPPIVASTFPTLVSGDAGRVAYTFLGTSVGAQGVDPFATGFHGVWYAYTSFTYDGGLTWTTVRDTPTPLQYGEIDAGGTTTSGQRNLLDFIDSSVTKEGRVLVALADGCLADCEAAGASGQQTTAEGLSTHAYATVSYQTAGRGLFSAYDVVVVPTAPTLTATGGPAVNLSWTAPMDNGGAPVTGYTVSRSAGGAPAVVATVNGLTYTDATAVRGTTYSYTVKALNSAGSSPASNAASAVTFTVPDAPVLTVAASGKDAALSWSVADNGGSPITGYQVLRGTAAGAEVALTTTTATSLVDTGLAAGSTYYYQVVATNAAGSSAPSTEVSFSNATLPDAPVVTATGGVNKISLSWPAPYDGGAPISGYVLSRGTSSGVQAEFARLGAATSYVDTAVTPGTTYYYRLQAINSVGSSMNSAETFATAITTAGAPTLSAISGRNQVALSWTVPTSGGSAITGYQIYRGLAAGTETLIQTISNGTSYVDATVTGGTPYSYRVAAVTTAGAGALSNAVSVTPRRGK